MTKTIRGTIAVLGALLTDRSKIGTASLWRY